MSDHDTISVTRKDKQGFISIYEYDVPAELTSTLARYKKALEEIADLDPYEPCEVARAVRIAKEAISDERSES